MKRFVPAFSDLTSLLACVAVTNTSWRSSMLHGCFFCSSSAKFSIKETKEVNLWSILPRIKVWKIPEIKKNIFPQRQNEGPVVTVKSPAKDDECCSCFLNYYTVRSMEKKVTGRVCQKCNIWYHEIWVGAKGKRHFICDRCHWSELYHQMIGIVPMDFFD